MSIAVVNGKMLDESQKVHVRNLLIQGSKITGVGYVPDEDEDNLTLRDVTQSMILPNTFDFLPIPDPSNIAEYTTFIQSKGMMNVAYIPNDSTVSLDSPEALTRMKGALGDVSAHVSFVGCASQGNGSDALSEMSLLVAAGASAIYFGRIIENDTLFKQALTYVDMIGVPIIFGPMTQMQKNNAHLNAGPVSFEIGIRGESEDVELATIQYVLGVVQSTISVPVHFQCVSSSAAIQCINDAKKNGCSVTVGVSPFHLIFSDDYLGNYNPKLKFNPPLRSKDTMQSLMQLVSSGMVDHLTALHFPQVGDSQVQSFYDHPFGCQTLDYFFQVVSHCLVGLGMSLDRYDAILSCPSPLKFVDSVTMGLNSQATFIVLKAVLGDATSHTLFDTIDVSLDGGVQLVMVNGELITS